VNVRRYAVAATQVVGTTLLGRSLLAEPGSRRFYRATYATAATWVAGGLASSSRPQWTKKGAAEGIAVGTAAFGLFYGCAHVARRIPVLRRALTSAFRHVDVGRTSAVATTTVVNGIAEEVFFRGAVQDLLGGKRSAALYVAAVAGSRNPALVLAAAIMGPLWAWQRERSGGLLAPMLAHVAWSMLMLQFVTPLFT
jgi:membrane protease YdiL (CAAX protease family)